MCLPWTGQSKARGASGSGGHRSVLVVASDPRRHPGSPGPTDCWLAYGHLEKKVSSTSMVAIEFSWTCNLKRGS